MKRTHALLHYFNVLHCPLTFYIYYSCIFSQKELNDGISLHEPVNIDEVYDEQG